jgi:hypothetical protein
MKRRDKGMIDHSDRRRLPKRDESDPPLRLAHVLFVLWVSGSVAWALYAAKLAHGQDWWMTRPFLAAILVLTPPILVHILFHLAVRITGNPKLR